MRALVLAAAGSILVSASAAHAAVTFNNPQVYRWQYLEKNGTRTHQQVETTGLAYQSAIGVVDGSYDGNAAQRGYTPGSPPPSVMNAFPTRGELSAYWERVPRFTTDVYEGQSYVATRFSINETLTLSLDGMINSFAMLELTYGLPSLTVTNWTRLRLLDASTGATVLSRLVRRDADHTASTGTGTGAAQRAVDIDITLNPNRYHLILDSYFEIKPHPDATWPSYDNFYSPGGLAGGSEQRPFGGPIVWDLRASLSRPGTTPIIRPTLAAVPEPTTLGLLAAVAGAASLRRRGR